MEIMKNNTDFLLRGIIKKDNIRFSFTETTTTVTEGIKIHCCDPVSALLFGRALTTAVLMAPLLGEKEHYSIKWEYAGTAKGMLADVTEHCEVRGVPFNVDLISAGSQDEIYGYDGQITLLKFKEGQILNSGIAKAGLMEVCGDVAFFMSTSDQIETEIAVASTFNPDPLDPVKIFSGIMLQAMPGCDLELFQEYRLNLQKEETLEIINSKKLPFEIKLWKIMESVIGDVDSVAELKKNSELEYSFAEPPVYKCSCSKERMLSAIKLFDKEEIEDIFSNKDFIRVVCHFCNTEYKFKEDEIEEI